jgi:hypothetical protein
MLRLAVSAAPQKIAEVKLTSDDVGDVSAFQE